MSIETRAALAGVTTAEQAYALLRRGGPVWDELPANDRVRMEELFQEGQAQTRRNPLPQNSSAVRIVREIAGLCKEAIRTKRSTISVEAILTIFNRHLPK